MRYLSVLLLFVSCLLMSTPSMGEELWVRNRPFKGQVQGSGASMKVELAPLVEALKLEIDVQGNQVVFGEFLVPIDQLNDGTKMVLLTDMVTGAGLKLKSNPTLGTIDVYSGAAGTGSKGDWDSLATTASGGSSGVHETDDYKIKIPPDLQLTNDPTLMKMLKQYAGEESGDKAALSNAKFEFILQPKDGSTDAAFMLARMGGVPPMASMPQSLQQAVVQGFGQGISQRGPIRSGPTEVKIGDRTYYRYEHEESGGQKKMESYLYINAPKGELYVVMFGDRASSFQKSASSFRKALDSLRIK